jgi:hypothetical protein
MSIFRDRGAIGISSARVTIDEVLEQSVPASHILRPLAIIAGKQMIEQFFFQFSRFPTVIFPQSSDNE